VHKFLGRAKFINPLGQKPAFGWFLSCVGKMSTRKNMPINLYSSIKLPFDAELDEKLSNVI
jgi:hypothetical protein